MKIILIIVGLAAAAFGGLHLVSLPVAISSAHGTFAASTIGAHVAGAAIGALVSIICLRKGFSSAKPQDHN